MRENSQESEEDPGPSSLESSVQEPGESEVEVNPVDPDDQESLHCKSVHSEIGLVSRKFINLDISESGIGIANEGDEKKVEFRSGVKSSPRIEYISSDVNLVNKGNEKDADRCDEKDLYSAVLSETLDQDSSYPVEFESNNGCHITLTAEENIVKNILHYAENEVEKGEIKEEKEQGIDVKAKVEMLKRRTLSQIKRQGKQRQKEKEEDKKGGKKERHMKGKQENDVEKEVEEDEDFDFDEESDFFDGN